MRYVDFNFTVDGTDFTDRNNRDPLFADLITLNNLNEGTIDVKFYDTQLVFIDCVAVEFPIHLYNEVLDIFDHFFKGKWHAWGEVVTDE
jgi:hypothetical protein